MNACAIPLLPSNESAFLRSSAPSGFEAARAKHERHHVQQQRSRLVARVNAVALSAPNTAFQRTRARDGHGLGPLNSKR